MSIKYDDNFISRFARKSGKTPILFFLSCNEKGETQYQGYIYHLRKDGTGRACIFSWVDGEENGDMEFTRAFLTECKFYSTEDGFRRDADRIGQVPPLYPALHIFARAFRAGREKT